MQVMVLEQKDINDIPFFLEKKLRKPPYQIQLNTAKGSFLTCVRRVYVSNAAAHTDFLPIELNMCLSTRESVSHADTFHMSSMYDESYSARWNAKRVAERDAERDSEELKASGKRRAHAPSVSFVDPFNDDPPPGMHPALLEGTGQAERELEAKLAMKASGKKRARG